MEAHADDNNEVINAQRDTTTLGTSVLLCKDSTGLEQAAPERETNNIYKDAASRPLRLTSLSTRSSYTNRKVTESYHGGGLKGQLGPLLLLKQNHFCGFTGAAGSGLTGLMATAASPCRPVPLKTSQTHNGLLRETTRGWTRIGVSGVTLHTARCQLCAEYKMITS